MAHWIIVRVDGDWNVGDGKLSGDRLPVQSTSLADTKLKYFVEMSAISFGWISKLNSVGDDIFSTSVCDSNCLESSSGFWKSSSESWMKLFTEQ